MFETVTDYIARTNLFNFILFASIIAFIFVKLDVIGMIEKDKDSVSETIKNSEKTKAESEENLKTASDKLSGLPKEIDNIISSSEENANLVGNKILSDTNITLENMRLNTEKLVENKTDAICNDIFRRASIASVEVAKSKIIEELNNNNELHNKLIDESVEEINGVKL